MECWAVSEFGYRPPSGRWRVSVASLVAAAAGLLLLFFVLRPSLQFQPRVDDARDVERSAIALMTEAMRVIARARAEAGWPVNPLVDPNETGLIGVEWSVITTTFGELEAKRTATNPLWAAYVARRMAEAGVGAGDVVWATFSGSFPGLNVAVLAAAEALSARLYAVSSLSASSWGANWPEFTWADMERAARQAGLFARGSVAVTLGGDFDQGPRVFGWLAGDEEAGVEALRQAAARTGWPLLEPASLAEAVTLRVQALRAASGVDKPALFVNVGGAHAALGDCSTGASWPAGLTLPGQAARPCGGRTPGLMYVMHEQGVAVLHLLNVRGLAAAAGIPVDGRFSMDPEL